MSSPTSLSASRRNHAGPSTSYLSPGPQVSPTPRASTSVRPLLNHNLSNPPPRLRSHAGCVLCGLVASVSATLTSDNASDGSASPSPRAVTTSFLQAQQAPYPDSFAPTAVTRTVHGREILFHDNDITIYAAEGKERLCSEGRHLIVVLNRHLESVYDLSPSDIPLLSHILATTQQLLLSLPTASSSADAERRRKLDAKDIRVGFVGNIRRDPQSPHAHLHAHAMLGPMDSKLPGASVWRRKVIFGAMNWWGVEDLRAEIRESASNNRVKSGYADRAKAPIDQVPDAGAITGLPNALDPDPYTDNQPDLSQDQTQRRVPLHRQSTADSDVTAKADEPRTSTSSNDGYMPVEL